MDAAALRRVVVLGFSIAEALQDATQTDRIRKLQPLQFMPIGGDTDSRCLAAKPEKTTTELRLSELADDFNEFGRAVAVFLRSTDNTFVASRVDAFRHGVEGLRSQALRASRQRQILATNEIDQLGLRLRDDYLSEPFSSGSEPNTSSSELSLSREDWLCECEIWAEEKLAGQQARLVGLASQQDGTINLADIELHFDRDWKSERPDRNASNLVGRIEKAIEAESNCPFAVSWGKGADGYVFRILPSDFVKIVPN